MNVYAVYKSPPSRNHVTIVPKRLPPSAHSSNDLRFACPQRAAKKPSTATPNTNTRKIIDPLVTSASSRGGVDDPNDQRRKHDPKNLIPIEKREPEEGRCRACIQRRNERGCERYQ